MLKTTSDDHFYQKGSPSDVLYLLEKLESLINAAYLIYDANLIFIAGDTSSEMDSVHRNLDITLSMLSKEEIVDPIKVLVDFFSYKSLKEWKEELIEINSFALSKHPAQEWGAWIDTLSVFVYSIKLTEVLYLIGRCYDDQIE